MLMTEYFKKVLAPAINSGAARVPPPPRLLFAGKRRRAAVVSNRAPPPPQKHRSHTRSHTRRVNATRTTDRPTSHWLLACTVSPREVALGRESWGAQPVQRSAKVLVHGLVKFVPLVHAGTSFTKPCTKTLADLCRYGFPMIPPKSIV